MLKKCILDTKHRTDENKEVMEAVEGDFLTLYSKEEILQYERDFLEKYRDFKSGFYVVNEAGETLDAEGYLPIAIRTEMENYQAALKNEKLLFGYPFVARFPRELRCRPPEW